ncbi:hypothetical protein FPV67DRAFT_1449070 [Lyophyllum atratum]|nr:hypothetical protein FPV67DRAFT_1449070 [Lyophyllum atratum]
MTLPTVTKTVTRMRTMLFQTIARMSMPEKAAEAEEPRAPADPAVVPALLKDLATKERRNEEQAHVAPLGPELSPILSALSKRPLTDASAAIKCPFKALQSSDAKSRIFILSRVTQLYPYVQAQTGDISPSSPSQACSLWRINSQARVPLLWLVQCLVSPPYVANHVQTILDKLMEEDQTVGNHHDPSRDAQRDTAATALTAPTIPILSLSLLSFRPPRAAHPRRPNLKALFAPSMLFVTPGLGIEMNKGIVPAPDPGIVRVASFSSVLIDSSIKPVTEVHNKRELGPVEVFRGGFASVARAYDVEIRSRAVFFLPRMIFSADRYSAESGNLKKTYIHIGKICDACFLQYLPMLFDDLSQHATRQASFHERAIGPTPKRNACSIIAPSTLAETEVPKVLRATLRARAVANFKAEVIIGKSACDNRERSNSSVWIGLRGTSHKQRM